MKKKIVAIILILIAIGLITCALVIKKDDNTSTKKEPEKEITNNNVEKSDLFKYDSNNNKYNISEKVKLDHESDGFIMSNVKITSDKEDFDYATMSFDIENKSGKDEEDLIIRIIFYDTNSKELSDVLFEFGKIKKNEKIHKKYKMEYRIIDCNDFTIAKTIRGGK